MARVHNMHAAFSTLKSRAKALSNTLRNTIYCGRVFGFRSTLLMDFCYPLRPFLQQRSQLFEQVTVWEAFLTPNIINEYYLHFIIFLLYYFLYRVENNGKKKKPTNKKEKLDINIELEAPIFWNSMCSFFFFLLIRQSPT